MVQAALWLAAGALSLGLAGCTDALPSMQANVAPAAQLSSRLPARPGVSPAGATVAFVNLGGAPVNVGTRFAASMSQALGARKIFSEEATKANYLIRGDMTAYAVEGGTAVSYVWDIYDSRRRRLQRLEDEVLIKASAADPWGVVDDKTLAAIAGRSAAEMAAFLTHTPEAIAAAAQNGGGPAVAPAPATGAPPQPGPLAYAPLR